MTEARQSSEPACYTRLCVSEIEAVQVYAVCPVHKTEPESADDAEHRSIRRVNQGVQAVQPLPAANSDKLLHQLRPEPPVLKIISNKNRHFGATRFSVNEIPAVSNQLRQSRVTMTLSDEAHAVGFNSAFHSPQPSLRIRPSEPLV
jgi:hypothetical protein